MTLTSSQLQYDPKINWYTLEDVTDAHSLIVGFVTFSPWWNTVSRCEKETQHCRIQVESFHAYDWTLISNVILATRFIADWIYSANGNWPVEWLTMHGKMQRTCAHAVAHWILWIWMANERLAQNPERVMHGITQLRECLRGVANWCNRYARSYTLNDIIRQFVHLPTFSIRNDQ